MTFGIPSAKTHTHSLRSSVILNGGLWTMPSVMVLLLAHSDMNRTVCQCLPQFKKNINLKFPSSIPSNNWPTEWSICMYSSMPLVIWIGKVMWPLNTAARWEIYTSNKKKITKKIDTNLNDKLQVKQAKQSTIYIPYFFWKKK